MYEAAELLFRYAIGQHVRFVTGDEATWEIRARYFHEWMSEGTLWQSLRYELIETDRVFPHSKMADEKDLVSLAAEPA